MVKSEKNVKTILFYVRIPLLGILDINSLLLGNSNVEDNMAVSSLVTLGSNQVQSPKKLHLLGPCSLLLGKSDIPMLLLGNGTVTLQLK